MNFRNTIASFAIIAALTGGVQAANLTPHGTHQDWNGVSFGLHGGYHFGSITQAGCTGVCPGPNDSVDNAYLAALAAYDYQKPGDNAVLGTYFVVPLASPDVDVNVGGFNFNVNPRYSVAAGLRLGYAFDDMLLYAYGGVQWTMVEITGPGGSDKANHNGTHFGFGLERAFAKNWTMDIRYTFIDADKETYNLGGGPENFGEHGSLFTLGVNYHLEPR